MRSHFVPPSLSLCLSLSLKPSQLEGGGFIIDPHFLERRHLIQKLERPLQPLVPEGTGGKLAQKLAEGAVEDMEKQALDDTCEVAGMGTGVDAGTVQGTAKGLVEAYAERKCGIRSWTFAPMETTDELLAQLYGGLRYG